MAGGRRGKPKHSRESLERALAAWIRTGSAGQAERETGIPAGTLWAYKHRHPETFEELTRVFERELQDKRRAIAAEVVEGIREGALVCRRLLRSDLQGAALAAQAAASVVRALTSVDANLDKIARLDAGSPTSITEDRRSDGDVIAEIEAALNDPAVRAAMASQQDER